MQSRIFCPVFVLAMLLLASMANAMTPGAEKATWDPAAINGLTSDQINALNSANCKIVSYRDMEDPKYVPNTSGKPDKQDKLMLVKGEFAIRGQKDLLALCQLKGGKAEFFFVIWGGPVQCKDTLMLRNISKFWKERDPNLDYYGSGLGVIPLAAIRNEIERAGRLPAYSLGIGATHSWVLPKGKRPDFDHDAFMLSGQYSLIFYCHNTVWVKLHDYYSDEID